MLRAIAFALLLTACASADPMADVYRAQQRLDERGLGFGVTRVPGYDAYVFQVRFATSEADPTAGEGDPMAAAQAAAPEGCSVSSLTPLEDGVSWRAEYEC
jgi:hypothetical protein